MAIDGTNEAKVGWVWSGNNRSTFDVLWSCLAVILVCTYKVIHLNLPARTEAEAPWYQLLFWKKWSRKLKWMGFMALSPELLLSMALADFLWSRQSEKQFAVLEGHSEPSTTSRKKDVNAIELAENGEATSKKRSKPNSLPFGYVWFWDLFGSHWPLLKSLDKDTWSLCRHVCTHMPSCNEWSF